MRTLSTLLTVLLAASLAAPGMAWGAAGPFGIGDPHAPSAPAEPDAGGAEGSGETEKLGDDGDPGTTLSVARGRQGRASRRVWAEPASCGDSRHAATIDRPPSAR